MRATLGVYRDLLGNGPLVRLLAGEFISSIGDWLYLVALLIVVDEQTGDPILLGVVGGLRVLPYVVLSVPAGMAADRFDRRIILLVTDAARGTIMILLAIVVATGTHWVAVVALSTLATCFSCFFGPTIGSYLPSLARDERQLGPANSAWSTLDNLAFIVGPALAFLIIAVLDLTLAFVLNAVSFAVCMAFVWGLPPGRPGMAGGAPESNLPANAEEGAEAPPREPSVRPLAGLTRPLTGLAIMGAVSSFVFGGIGILTVILASDVYESGSETTGLLNAAIGIGGLAGALASGALVVRRRLAGPLLVGVAGFGIGTAALGLVDTLGPAMVAIAILAGGNLLVDVVGTTVFQRLVPDEFRGRVLGGIGTVGEAAYVLGSFALPFIAVSFGIAPVLVACGAFVVAGGLATVALVGPAATAAPAPVPIPVRRAARLPVFAGVPASRLDDILGRLTTVDVRADEVVIHEGDTADRFYIIDAGLYRVTQLAPDGSQLFLRTMERDEVFGEIGLLTGRPRTATVTAETQGRLLALGAEDFADLVSSGPGLMNRLLDLHRGATASRAETGATVGMSAG